ncbi:MAG TPA: hypothetical protein DCZ11_06670 [Gammaproteobacteria bacterium]|nr:hypothetical protein [Gammaproteobacteria bacterium]MCH78109.1 hypothetical protein [Gammaproteobacteria bacterium]
MNLSRKGWFHVLASWLIAWGERTAPDFIIHNATGEYLRRRYLLPRNPLLNAYLHEIVGPDDDRALHCHPWWNGSLILQNGYDEVLPLTQEQDPAFDYWHGGTTVAERRTGDVIFRTGGVRHRLVDRPDLGTTWTLFITGPQYRLITWLRFRSAWGFHCRNGFVPWRRFVSARDKGTVGAGCGD